MASYSARCSRETSPVIEKGNPFIASGSGITVGFVVGGGVERGDIEPGACRLKITTGETAVMKQVVFRE